MCVHQRFFPGVRVVFELFAMGAPSIVFVCLVTLDWRISRKLFQAVLWCENTKDWLGFCHVFSCQQYYWR